MKRIIIATAIMQLAICTTSFAQVFYTKNGKISFFSKTSLEDITADNNQVLSVLNTETGVLEFSALNNAFHFPKAKMEDDFNDNYIESAKYPKSTFKGTIADVSGIKSMKDGSYPVSVKGDLEIHGVSKNITAPATVTIKDGKISATASFKVLPKDYNIKVPSIVAGKIAESITINVSCNYEKK
jgi:YceI-like domain